MVIDLNSFLSKIILLLILLSINLILKLKSLNAPIDYDSASHLYFAFLKNRKIKFLHSYSFGIKYIIPRLYSILGKLVIIKPYYFRFFNIMASSLVIALLVFSNPVFNLNAIFLLILAVLLINSLWVYYQTSASEFYEVIIIMCIFYLALSGQNIYYFISEIILLMLLIGAFKISNLIYVIPLLVFNYNYIILHWSLAISSIVILLSFVYLCGSKSFQSVGKYAHNRNWLNPKSTFFLKNSPFFLFLILGLGLGNIIYSSLPMQILQITVWVIFLAQRTYTSYFYYPLIVIGFFIAFQSHWIINLPLYFIISLVVLIFILHTLRYILTKSAKQIEITAREKFFGSGNYMNYLNTREQQIEWLRHYINSEPVYLWGSNIPLMVLTPLIHMGDTFYNHNHLVYWSINHDLAELITLINRKKPVYILESAIMKDFPFPADEFKDYKLINSISDLKIYKLNNI